jgi:methylmalonyl-CoA mutase N-terminal domain/subunit
VNAFQETDEKPLDILEIDQAVESEQIESLRRVKADRSNDDLRRTMDAVRRAAEAQENVMPALIDVARSRATVGEVMNALADVYGRCDTAVV